MMPILYIGGYSEMDGLQLTCEFTFNKKEKKGKKKLLYCSVEVLYCPCSYNVLFSLNLLPQCLSEKGHCGFKKLNCPLACAERCDWWARWSPWRRAGNRSCCSSLCVGALGLSGFHSEK